MEQVGFITICASSEHNISHHGKQEGHTYQSNHCPFSKNISRAHITTPHNTTPHTAHQEPPPHYRTRARGAPESAQQQAVYSTVLHQLASY